MGSAPEKSPYQDFDYHQDFSIWAGYFGGNKGEAGDRPAIERRSRGFDMDCTSAARRSSPFESGARSRSGCVLDPPRPATLARVGTMSDPIWIADAGINVALTGKKSFHHLIPQVGVRRRGGDEQVGRRMWAAMHSAPALQFTWRCGLKFVTHGAWGARIDRRQTTYWQLSYPGGYFLAPTGGTAILSPSQAQNEWKPNPVITFGITYIFSALAEAAPWLRILRTSSTSMI